MELHIQKCQNCGSRQLRNILVRNLDQKVYVQCRACEQLVARYILTPGGYYHEGKEFESFLRSIELEGDPSSAKDLRQLFEDTRINSQQEYHNVLELLKEKYANHLP